MQLVGKITEVIDKSEGARKKKVALITNGENPGFYVEFRKQFYTAISILKLGDLVNVACREEPRRDDRGNHYNNLIAESLERR